MPNELWSIWTYFCNSSSAVEHNIYCTILVNDLLNVLLGYPRLYLGNSTELFQHYLIMPCKILYQYCRCLTVAFLLYFCWKNNVCIVCRNVTSLFLSFLCRLFRTVNICAFIHLYTFEQKLVEMSVLHLQCTR